MIIGCRSPLPGCPGLDSNPALPSTEALKALGSRQQPSWRMLQTTFISGCCSPSRTLEGRGPKPCLWTSWKKFSKLSPSSSYYYFFYLPWGSHMPSKSHLNCSVTSFLFSCTPTHLHLRTHTALDLSCVPISLAFASGSSPCYLPLSVPLVHRLLLLDLWGLCCAHKNTLLIPGSDFSSWLSDGRFNYREVCLFCFILWTENSQWVIDKLLLNE